MRAVLLFGLAWAEGDDGHDHHHAHGHGAASCGCEKDEPDHPFAMDCSDTDAIRKAGTDLKDCGTASEEACKGALAAGNPKCQTAFFILQSHHDYCDHDTLTSEEEMLVHDWEGSCIQCAVYRGHSATLDNCPVVDCETAKPAEDAHALLDAECADAKGKETGCCTTADQKVAFQTMIAYHDLCAHDDIPLGVEEAVHDYEHACEDYMCNIVKTGYDGTKCEDDYADAYLIKGGDDDHDDHEGHDHGDDEEVVKESAAGVLGVMSAALLLHA